ncbi:MAG: hydantoinase B/oxoprolinase family protein, partial [bacterium]|nr:hydantoinase B/oxoprolinase family protein [bacterium]
MKINPIDLEVFKNRFSSICEEMGVTLCRSSFSPNIKERKDFSCAIFDEKCNLVAQAAHIPVHLGSMPLSVQAATQAFKLRKGDAVILNDPYYGGTHLPDITLVSPVFLGKGRQPTFYVANRAHHSDVGGQSPGSMPVADHLEKEGVVIPPTLFQKRGRLNQAWIKNFLKQVRSPKKREADLLAQQSANRIGAARLQEIVERVGRPHTLAAMHAYQRYEEKITLQALGKIKSGHYAFTDYLDDDGIHETSIKISVRVTVSPKQFKVDFTESVIASL